MVSVRGALIHPYSHYNYNKISTISLHVCYRAQNIVWSSLLSQVISGSVYFPATLNPSI